MAQLDAAGTGDDPPTARPSDDAAHILSTGLGRVVQKEITQTPILPDHGGVDGNHDSDHVSTTAGHTSDSNQDAQDDHRLSSGNESESNRFDQSADEGLDKAPNMPRSRKQDRSDSIISDSVRVHRLHRFALYETNARYFITGADVSDKHFKILKIDRTAAPGHLSVFEDDIVYTKHQVNQLLTAIDEGNKATGGLRHKFNFWGLLGFIRFTESYYMLVITKRQQVAMLGGHYIYQIESTELVPLATGASTRFAQNRNPDESRFLGIFSSLDLNKNFYFSYTYNITRTLQHNITQERLSVAEGYHKPLRDHNDMFVWNTHLLNPARKALDNLYDWCVPVMHGFIDQAALNVFGRTIYITIVGRRSRFFAGARFLKRGVNDLGYVANDVETEQIVSEMLTTSFHAPGPRLFSNPTYTSYVHHRGSIPLYWTQDNSGVTPKPAIDINLNDPFYQSAALHFNNLFGRYGCPIYVLNLIKARERTPRESKLLSEFKSAINYLNQFLPEDKQIYYEAFDMSRASKNRGGDVIGTLEKIAATILDKTNFFHNGDAIDQIPCVQNGIARTNCIDCLDRTNAAQFVIGKHAFGLQLQSLGVIPSPAMEYDSDAIDIFTHMFHAHGDTIAVQYGGSHLVNTMATYRKINHWQGHGRDMVESFKRYYHNSFLDSQRQEAYNLFLGNYIYSQGQPMLWDLSTDYYLHHSDPKLFLDRTRARKSYIDWFNPSYLTPRHLQCPPAPPPQKHKAFGLTDYDDFWAEYYRPLILSTFLKVYSFKLNADTRFMTERPATASVHDPSPFIPRLDPNRMAAPDSPGKKGRQHRVTILDPTETLTAGRAGVDEKGLHSPPQMRTSNVTAGGILVHPSTPNNGHGTESQSTPDRKVPLEIAQSNGISTTSATKPKDKTQMHLWTLNQIYENSLNPAVSAAEEKEYDRWVRHPSLIPLVVNAGNGIDGSGAVGSGHSGVDGGDAVHSAVVAEFVEYCAGGYVAPLNSYLGGGARGGDQGRSATDELYDALFDYQTPMGRGGGGRASSLRLDTSGTGGAFSVASSVGPTTPAAWDDMPDADMDEFRDFVEMGAREDVLTVFDEDRDKKRYKAYRQWLVKGKSLFKAAQTG